MKIECIATSLDDALAIEANGGDRIELISCLECGGYTPSDGLVRAVLASVSIPVAVMLRPNQSSFVYDDNQLSEMRRDALRFQEQGVRRVVIGILNDQGIADIETLAKIVESTDFDITFHRAIDESSDVEASLERINQYPRITHILTSLGRGKVSDNLDRLRWYAERARPTLILGSGVTHKNVGQIAQISLPYKTDIHVGTALRFGKASNPVHAPSLSSLADIFNRFGKCASSHRGSFHTRRGKAKRKSSISKPSLSILHTRRSKQRSFSKMPVTGYLSTSGFTLCSEENIKVRSHLFWLSGFG